MLDRPNCAGFIATVGTNDEWGAHRRKGDRCERELVERHREIGVHVSTIR